MWRGFKIKTLRQGQSSENDRRLCRRSFRSIPKVNGVRMQAWRKFFGGSDSRSSQRNFFFFFVILRCQAGANAAKRTSLLRNASLLPLRPSPPRIRTSLSASVYGRRIRLILPARTVYGPYLDSNGLRWLPIAHGFLHPSYFVPIDNPVPAFQSVVQLQFSLNSHLKRREAAVSSFPDRNCVAFYLLILTFV